MQRDEIPPAGGEMGDDYENTSSCDDRSGFGDGVFREIERGTDVPNAADTAEWASDSRITSSRTERESGRTGSDRSAPGRPAGEAVQQRTAKAAGGGHGT